MSQIFEAISGPETPDLRHFDTEIADANGLCRNPLEVDISKMTVGELAGLINRLSASIRNRQINSIGEADTTHSGQRPTST